MNRIRRPHTLVAVIALLIAACGSTGPQPAGPLTLPTTDTSVPASTAPTTAPTTTAPTGTGSTVPSPSAPPDSTPTTAGVSTSATTITIYLLDDGGHAIPVERRVTTKEVARAALEALIAGPTGGEAAAGLSTAVPDDTLVLGLRIDDGVATVDLSREVEAGGGSAAILGRLAQLVYSLTEFSSVDSVRILLDGERVPSFSGEGILIEEALDRADFAGSVPIGEPIGTDGTAVWDQDDLPAVEVGGSDSRLVVLVAADDVLNVRDAAGVEATILGTLAPGSAVRVTGDEAVVGASTWVAIATPVGPGWVNDFYLTPSIPEGTLTGNNDPSAVVAELAERLAGQGDLTEIVSERGLWISHHASPIRFRSDDLDGILGDPTTYRWGSNALEPNSPEIQPKTFAEAVADRFLDAYRDEDNRVVPGETIEGPNGRPAGFAIPTEFEGFPFMTVHDPGDDPQYDGLDWTQWIVSLALEDGDLKVIGLTLDEWAP